MNLHASDPAGIRSPMPLRPLLLVGAVVIALHLLVLQLPSGSLPTTASPLSQPFITRTIALAPEKPAPTPPQPPAPSSKPPSPRPPAPAPAQPVLAPSPEAASSESVIAPQTAAAEAPASPAVDAPPEPATAAAAATDVTPTPSLTLPGSLRLKYNIIGEVRSLNYSARAELLWTHDGSAYAARLEVGAFLLGSRVQTSTGRITPEGLAPKRFSDKVRSEVAAHFERDKGKVIFSANTPEIPLEPGAQDQLSIFVQLAGLLAGEPERYPPGSTIEMQAVGARDADIWRFTVDGPELLHLPGGDQATTKLTRPPRQPHDLKLELWLAPALGYLPARIRLTQDNGDFIDQQWRTSESP